MKSKERPIIFSGDMVRAILEGRKTQTRRVMKPQPNKEIHQADILVDTARLYSKNDCLLVPCPYGQPGDRLWVRETWYLNHNKSLDKLEVLYKSTEMGVVFENLKKLWRPSVHMPRWASRITLEITNVRVERVQEISEEDAEAEGMFPDSSPSLRSFDSCGGYAMENRHDYKTSFRRLWASLNAKRGYGWDVNPWVWVIEFRRIYNEK